MERLADFFMGLIADGESAGFRSAAGGGYGDPLRRDPARVAEDVNRKWLSPAAARDAYKVALRLKPNGIDYEADEDGTRALRAVE